MNADQFMGNWVGGEQMSCFDAIACMEEHQLLELAGGIIPESMEALVIGSCFYTHRLSNKQALAYAKLLQLKFDDPHGAVSTRFMPARVGKACHNFSLILLGHLEAAHLRGDRASIHSLFKAYTSALACLEKQIERDDVKLIERGMVERWAEALSYDFVMADAVEQHTWDFLNKALVLRQDKAASVILHSLKQQSLSAAPEQRPVVYAEKLASFLGFMKVSRLVLMPKDPGPLLVEISKLDRAFLRGDSQCVSAIKSEIIAYLVDPATGGKHLGHTYSKGARKALEIKAILNLSETIDRILAEDEGVLGKRDLWRHKSALINALARSQDFGGTIGDAMLRCMTGLSDVQMTEVMGRCTPKAARLLTAAVRRRMPDKIELLPVRWRESLLMSDLGI